MKTWQDAYVEAHAACETDLPHKRLEAGIEAAVNFALASCAAAPWRYDVENAPKDEYCIVLFKGGSWNIGKLGNKYFFDIYGIVFRDSVIAFATINLPEVKP